MKHTIRNQSITLFAKSLEFEMPDDATCEEIDMQAEIFIRWRGDLVGTVTVTCEVPE